MVWKTLYETEINMLPIEARNQHVVLLPRFSESISLFALFIDNVIRTDGIHSLNDNAVLFSQMSLQHVNAGVRVLFAAIHVACFTVRFVGFPQTTVDAVLLGDVLQNGAFASQVTIAIITVWHDGMVVQAVAFCRSIFLPRLDLLCVSLFCLPRWEPILMRWRLEFASVPVV